MNRKLKIFGLAALIFALVAGAAFAVNVNSVTVAGNDPTNFVLGKQVPAATALLTTNFNSFTGSGTLLGNFDPDVGGSLWAFNPLQPAGAAPALVFPAFVPVAPMPYAAWPLLPNPSLVMRLNATKGSELVFAPATGSRVDEGAVLGNGLATTGLQIVVNAAGNDGKVIMKASNGDNPGPVTHTRYFGGTVQEGGTLGVTNNNALGQRWVGVVANNSVAKAPVFRVEGVDVLQLGVNDPNNQVTYQPMFLMFRLADRNEVTYATLEAPANVNNLQGLRLNHGLDQRMYGPLSRVDTANNNRRYPVLYAPLPVYPNDCLSAGPVAGAVYDGSVPVAGEGDVLASALDAQALGFVRLTKTGKGMLYVNSDYAAPAAPAGDGFDGIVATSMYLPVDGAHHRGGTDVKEGTLEVSGGNATKPQDHFRGSLGKVWGFFQGIGAAPETPYNPRHYVVNAVAGGALYNPLWIRANAAVKVNRSQFFSDFNTEAASTFEAGSYTLSGVNYNPQIAVTLDQNDSNAKGLLKGQFDLVVSSVFAAARPATTHPVSAAIANAGQAILFIDNEENEIFATGETLVANGVLQIAGAKSIGGGRVTVGANPAVDRGFGTPGLATFAASKTFKLDNVTVTKTGGALAAEDGANLSFKDITVNGNLRINPRFVTALGVDDLPRSWGGVSGTITFGAPSSADATYAWAGVMRAPNNIDIERGVWHLESFPTPTANQIVTGQDPFAVVTIWQNGVLSLAKDQNDWQKYMDVIVVNDSRIRMVLRPDDIADSRKAAMAKPALFSARDIDYSAIGYGEIARDLRLAIQLDLKEVGGKLAKGQWVKLVYSKTAADWNALHFLRENSDVAYEDYAKVRLTFENRTDLEAKAVAHLDENSYTILMEVTEDVDPNPQPPAPVVGSLSATLASSATDVAPGTEVTFTLGDIKKADGTVVPVADVDFGTAEFTNCTEKTAFAGGVVVVTAGNTAGAMTVKIPVSLKADATVKGFATGTATVAGAPAPTPTGGGSSGGCDAGFAGLALLLAVPMFFRKKD